MSDSDDGSSSSSSNTRDSAPDLQILGDQISLQPSGFIAPPAGVSRHEAEKEEALMKHMASFRSEPLQ